jgi:hypothetical protein
MQSPEHRELLVVEQGVGAFTVNVVINGAIGWLLFRSIAEIPLWGETSVGGDLLATALLLPLLSGLIVSKIVGRKPRMGKLSPLPNSQIPDLGWSLRSSLV